MKFTRLKIPEIVVCEPNFLVDNRGYFCESYRNDKLEAFLGYKINFCQENQTKSKYGVLRGLHYQQAPHGQTKLVRVVNGSVLDVVVDIRRNSINFGKHVSIKLSAENNKQILIPPGFAHGFVCLEDEVTLIYKVDNYYNNDSERGIAYDDKDLSIDWQLNKNEIQVSEKDKNQPFFKDSEPYYLS